MHVEETLTKAEALRAFRRVQIIAEGVALVNVQVKATETPIEHGLGRVPVGFIEVNRGPLPVMYSRAPDQRNIYVYAGSEITADLWVF